MLRRKMFLVGLLGCSFLPAPSFADEPHSSDHKPATSPHGPIFTGQFTGVDTATGTVTLQNKHGEAHTFTVGAEAKIEINGKAATLTDLKTGMYGGVKLNAAGDTVLMVKAADAAQHSQAKIYSGKVTKLEGATVTLTNKDGSATFTIPAGAAIQINGKPATVEALKLDMHGGVKLSDDGQTVQEARFYEAK